MSPFPLDASSRRRPSAALPRLLALLPVLLTGGALGGAPADPGSGSPLGPAGAARTATAPLPTLPAGAVRGPAVEPGARVTPKAPESLDTELVYAVLVAEVAVQRGDMQTAFTHYLHAAELARDPGLAELAVRAAVSGNDDAGAGRAAELWLQLAPEAPGASQVSALLRLKAGDRDGALTHLSRLVRLPPLAGESGYLQAAGVIGRGVPPAERLDFMGELVRRDETNADAQFALAVVAASAEQEAAATAAAERALALRPNWDEPRLFLVRLLLGAGKRDEARARLEAYVAATPDSVELGMFLGQLLVEEQDYAQARGVFERVLETRPGATEALFAAAVLSLELDDLDRARAYLTRLYQSGERRDEASLYLGQTEERAGHPAAARDWYAKAQGGSRLDARLRMALLEAKAGEIERARDIVQQLRDELPEQARPLFLAEAELLDQANQAEAAWDAYRQALAALPDDADILYARAMFAVKLDRIPEAEQDLRRILARDPNHADALNALGYTLADRTDRYQEALPLIERAYQLKPKEPAILDSMGWVNFKLGRREKALDYLQRAHELLPDGEIAAHLGAVLWAMGRQAEARTLWAEALKESPDHAYLKATMQRHGITDGAAAPAGGAP